MSFSSEIKQEILNNLGKIKNQDLVDAEKFGEMLVDVSYKNELTKPYEKYLDIAKLEENSIKAILKGAFLASGCIVDPNTSYHIEILIRNKSCAQYLFNLLSVLDFTPKLLKRKQSNLYVIYWKESEQISRFLSMLEANTCKLFFENIRVQKEVTNQINRSVNCETANLSKMASVSSKQIDAIQKIKEAKKFQHLSPKLKYTANLRLQYPEASLDTISSLTTGTNHISKSGLKHRLDKIIEIAANIDKE